jgi:hypothetical protein
MPFSDPLTELREYLATLPEGKVENQAELIHRLAPCWDKLDGSGDEGMFAKKLDRMEDPQWNPPKLTFLLERHGRTVQGSSRAQVHRWTIDVSTGKAECEYITYRQVRPRAAPLNVDAIVSEIVGCITSGAADPRLKWLADSAQVRVLVPTFITGEYKQTIKDRRKRFRMKLEIALEEKGWVWVPGKRDVFRRPLRSSQFHAFPFTTVSILFTSSTTVSTIFVTAV